MVIGKMSTAVTGLLLQKKKKKKVHAVPDYAVLFEYCTSALLSAGLHQKLSEAEYTETL